MNSFRIRDGVIEPPVLLASAVVYRLRQLHVPRWSGKEPITSLMRCAYDGHTWPCRERLILDGYEREL
jgi:hypothetical protein